MGRVRCVIGVGTLSADDVMFQRGLTRWGTGLVGRGGRARRGRALTPPSPGVPGEGVGDGVMFPRAEVLGQRVERGGEEAAVLGLEDEVVVVLVGREQLGDRAAAGRRL